MDWAKSANQPAIDDTGISYQLCQGERRSKSQITRTGCIFRSFDAFGKKRRSNSYALACRSEMPRRCVILRILWWVSLIAGLLTEHSSAADRVLGTGRSQATSRDRAAGLIGQRLDSPKPEASLFEPVGLVQADDLHRHPALGAQRLDRRPIEAEVLLPRSARGLKNRTSAPVLGSIDPTFGPL